MEPVELITFNHLSCHSSSKALVSCPLVLVHFLVHLHFNLVSSVLAQFQIGQPSWCEMITELRPPFQNRTGRSNDKPARGNETALELVNESQLGGVQMKRPRNSPLNIQLKKCLSSVQMLIELLNNSKIVTSNDRNLVTYMKPGTVLSMQMQMALWSFQTGGTKLERFLPKNQHTQRKLSNFENWVSGEVSKSAKSPNLLTFKVNLLYDLYVIRGWMEAGGH